MQHHLTLWLRKFVALDFTKLQQFYLRDWLARILSRKHNFLPAFVF